MPEIGELQGSAYIIAHAEALVVGKAVEQQDEPPNGVCASSAVVEKLGKICVAFFYDVLRKGAYQVAEKAVRYRKFLYGVGAGYENPVPAGVELRGVRYVQLRLEFFKPAYSYRIVVGYRIVVFVGDVVGCPREGVHGCHVLAEPFGNHFRNGKILVVGVREALAFRV